MLGSVPDAEDALQETLIRAWRGAAGLRAGSSARSWLYAIATNVCLTELERRRKRVLPHDFGPAAETGTPPGMPVAESIWLDPYPDDAFGLPTGKAAPEARYEQREGVELAFVAALQHLPANQRAVLILRDVLGFSAAESAQMLSTTAASVNSALQRAHAAVSSRVPGPHPAGQPARARRPRARRTRHPLRRRVGAQRRRRVHRAPRRGRVVRDAAVGHLVHAARLDRRVGAGVGDVRRVAVEGGQTRANGQPSLAFYSWDDAASAYLPFALNVLTLRDGLVSDVTAFIVRATDSPLPESYQNFPDQPFDAGRYQAAFARFGLPERLGADRQPQRAGRGVRDGRVAAARPGAIC